MNNKMLIESTKTIVNSKKDYTEINKNHDSKGYDFDNQVDTLEYWYNELEEIKFHLNFYKNEIDLKNMYNDTIELMSDINQLLNEMI